MTEPIQLLPVLGQRPRERSDAARNRDALLAAAQELVDRCGAAHVTMDAVAAAAGVGKGTVFRRFGSRQGLMAALLDRTEADFQAAVISGPPPLGPGAPPLERLLAFGGARLHHAVEHIALLDEAGGASRNFAVYSFTATHVRYLLGEIGVQGDITLLTTALLAPFEVPILRQQLEVEQIPADRIRAGWEDLARRVVAC